MLDQPTMSASSPKASQMARGLLRSAASMRCSAGLEASRSDAPSEGGGPLFKFDRRQTRKPMPRCTRLPVPLGGLSMPRIWCAVSISACSLAASKVPAPMKPSPPALDTRPARLPPATLAMGPSTTGVVSVSMTLVSCVRMAAVALIACVCVCVSG